jgi:hypothetical protein
MANNEKSFYQRLSELYPSLGIIDRTWRDKSGLYNSMGSASKNLGIAQSYISLCCAGLCGDTKLWSFKKVEG